jgi:hypothetical protein
MDKDKINEILSNNKDLTIFGFTDIKSKEYDVYRRMLQSSNNIEKCVEIISRISITKYSELSSRIISEKINFKEGEIILSSLYIGLKVSRIKKYNLRKNNPSARINLSATSLKELIL